MLIVKQNFTMPRTSTRPDAANLSKKRAASREDGQARKRPHIDSKASSKPLKPSKSKYAKQTPAETSEQKLPRRKNPVTAVAVEENESQSDDGASDDELEVGGDDVGENDVADEGMEAGEGNGEGENSGKSSTSSILLDIR